jgi:hypothetical protein
MLKNSKQEEIHRKMTNFVHIICPHLVVNRETNSLFNAS